MKRKETGWYSVETPCVFREYELPAEETDWTKRDRRCWRELENLAELHRTSIQFSTYRRG